MICYQAYPYQKFGHQKGVVESVAKTALPNNELNAIGVPAGGNGSEPRYRITVRLASQQVQAYGLHLLRGQHVAQCRCPAGKTVPPRMGAGTSLQPDRQTLTTCNRLSFGINATVPLMLQTEATECGLACLGMVAGYHGYRRAAGTGFSATQIRPRRLGQLKLP